MRRLFWYLIRKNREGKGKLPRDAAKALAVSAVWSYVPLAGEGQLGVGPLNMLAEPRGVRFGTGHHPVFLQHWVALGWCQKWRQGKSV